MMDDLISRQAAIDTIHKAVLEMFNFCDDIIEEPLTYTEEKMLEVNKLITGKIRDLPSAQPPADVAPVKHGEWIPSVDRWGDIITTVDGYTCSDCGFFNAYEDRYCPNCGAMMRKDDPSHPLADSDDIYGE